MHSDTRDVDPEQVFAAAANTRDYMRCLFDEAFRAAGVKPAERVRLFEYSQRCRHGERHE